jgi:hypothetical protein
VCQDFPMGFRKPLERDVEKWVRFPLAITL